MRENKRCAEWDWPVPFPGRLVRALPFPHSLPRSLQDSNGQVAGGGVSVYYSHVLQMLFFSYCQGRSFAATLNRASLEVMRLFPISIKR